MKFNRIELFMFDKLFLEVAFLGAPENLNVSMKKTTQQMAAVKIVDINKPSFVVARI